jgi:hypothetical protein
MDPQQLHLLVNHVPVIGSLWILLVLLAALGRPGPTLSRVALGLTVLLSLTTVVAHRTGEPAEEKLEHVSGVVEPAIEEHEEIAEKALAAGVATGVAALAGLLFSRGRPHSRWPLVPSIVLVSVCALLLGITAHQGGKIHRPELGDRPVSGEHSEPGS